MHPGGWTGLSGSRTTPPASAWCVKPPHRTETARKVEFPKSNGDESQSSVVERLESCCSLLCFDGAERALQGRGMDPQVLAGDCLPLPRMLTGSVHTSLPGAFPSPTSPANLLVPAQDGKLTLYLT